MHTTAVMMPSSRFVDAYYEWKASARARSDRARFLAKTVSIIAEHTFQILANLSLVVLSSVLSLGLAHLNGRFRSWSSARLTEVHDHASRLPRLWATLFKPNQAIRSRYQVAQTNKTRVVLDALKQRVEKSIAASKSLEEVAPGSGLFWVDDENGRFAIVRGEVFLPPVKDSISSENVTASKLEKLHYELAVIAGYGDLFVPTARVDVEMKDGKHFIGSCQANQMLEGWQSLSEVISTAGSVSCTDISVSRSALIRALVCAAFFGMQDAHSGNLLVHAEKGALEFFENARLGDSMAVTRKAGQLYCNFRCDLTRLPGARHRLIAGDFELLEKEVERLGKVIGQIRIFLCEEKPRSQQVKEDFGILKLPQGRMDPDSFLEGAKARLSNLRRALQERSKTDQSFSLFDLILSANPAYRLLVSAYVALKLTSSPQRSLWDKAWLAEVLSEASVSSQFSYDYLFTHLVKHGVDPFEVRRIANESGSSRELLAQLEELIQDAPHLSRDVLIDHRDQVLQELGADL